MRKDKDGHLVFVIAGEPVRVFCHRKRISSHHHRAGIFDGFLPRVGLSPISQVGIQGSYAAIAVVDEPIQRHGHT